MSIESIFNKYLEGVQGLFLQKRLMDDIAQNEIARFKNKKIEESVICGEEEQINSTHFFYIENAKTGNFERFNTVSKTVEQEILAIYRQKNKQYQWILSESYELFVDYITDIYAYIGFANKNLWLLKDFGNISLSDLDNKDFSFFKEQSKKKKNIPHSILNQIRISYPEYKRIETHNLLEKDLKFDLYLIENFRHVIVHCAGITNDPKLIAKKILSENGVWNNGKYDEQVFNYIISFFGSGDFLNEIILLEYSPDRDRMDRYIDILGILLNSLLTISSLIYKEIIRSEK